MGKLDWYLSASLKVRHLKLLVSIYDFRNLRQVASNSFVTVPAVSKALGEIERALGVQLFERTAIGLRPTAYGESVVRHARTVLSTLNQTAEEIKALQTGSAGKVFVGTTPLVVSTILPRALRLLKEDTPQTNVEIRENRMRSLVQELQRGDLDIIVGRLPNKSDSVGLREQVLLAPKTKLVTGSRHPLAKKSVVQWSDLADFPWVLPPVGSLLREPIENAFARHGLSIPANYIESLSNHLIRAYLQFNQAIALHTGDVVHPFGDVGSLHVLPVDLNLVTRPVGVLWREDKPLSPGAKSFLSCLEQVCVQHLAEDASFRPKG